MIRIICPSCGSKLNAKAALAGETRKCPKCGQPIRIAPESETIPNGDAANEPDASELIQPATEETLPSQHLPERLNRNHHYLICGKNNLVATWENNGNGWMLKSGKGFVSAKRNCEQLPSQGDFKLIELKFEMTPDGKRLLGIASYQLANRWAMIALDQGDDMIVEKITGHAGLNRDQKNAVRQSLKDQFMRQVWQDAAAVLEYLGNADFHSPGAG